MPTQMHLDAAMEIPHCSVLDLPAGAAIIADALVAHEIIRL